MNSDSDFDDSITIAGTCISTTVEGLLSNDHDPHAVMLAMISELASLASSIGADPDHVSEMVADGMDDYE